MNAEAKASQDKLLADLKVVVADTEQLIREATASSAEGFAALRTRFEEKLAETKAKIERTRAAVGEKIDRTRLATGEQLRHASDATQAYVKDNPWQTAGVLAAAAVILGFFLGRRAAPTDADVPVE